MSWELLSCASLWNSKQSQFDSPLREPLVALPELPISRSTPGRSGRGHPAHARLWRCIICAEAADSGSRPEASGRQTTVKSLRRNDLSNRPSDRHAACMARSRVRPPGTLKGARAGQQMSAGSSPATNHLPRKRFEKMRTMLDLLIRLEQMQQCCERVNHNPELTDREKSAALCFKDLVRDCLPSPVLATYDRLRKSHPDTLENAELFGMTVIVATYTKLPPSGRRKLLAHFSPRSRSRTGRVVLTRSRPNRLVCRTS